MKIENSPFYITNNSNNIKKELKVASENNSEPNVTKEKKIDNNENFSFWDWFRGLVNPFQNLPIISGIYSSVNSEDSKSDRDLIQNSLGGFMYGGPLGAIAGFGNWVFNKIFDKTPSEFALDATGISNLWKEDKNSEKIAHKKSDYIGKAELERQRDIIDAGDAPFKLKMVGITLGGKEITDYAPDFWLIADTDGNDMGYVTSPWWSPELETNIALAWVPWKSSEVGTKLKVKLPDEYSDSPGVPVDGEIVDVPFRESVNPNKREVQTAKGLDYAE